MLHAVMMTSHPALYYWEPASLNLIKAVQSWRKAGLGAVCTLDAGPNVHVICEQSNSELVIRRLKSIPGVKEVLVCHPGDKTHLL
jgi:diphosphomevalonate decarboxylase